MKYFKQSQSFAFHNKKIYIHPFGNILLYGSFRKFLNIQVSVIIVFKNMFSPNYHSKKLSKFDASQFKDIVQIF